jgi:hypothetical protein
MAKSARERMQEYRQRLREEKKKQVLVTLEPAVQEMIEDIRKKEGLTYSEAVNTLVLKPKNNEMDPPGIDQDGAYKKAKEELKPKKEKEVKIEENNLNENKGVERGEKDFAMRHAKMAVAQLKAIKNIKYGKQEAFDYVINWIENF